MNRKMLSLLVGLLLWTIQPSAFAKVLKIVYVSDLHYGLKREFRGQPDVPAYLVNRALIDKINHLPLETLPEDNGVGAGTSITNIDFVVNTGDIANRMEKGVQSATASWNEYWKDWSILLNITNDEGKKSPIYLLPGNHDVTNAIGFYRPMSPQKDAASLASIYRLMMQPSTSDNKSVFSASSDNFDYNTHKVRYSFTKEGIHFVFAGIWPDTETREWMARDMASLTEPMPVLVFAHDPATGIMKHFTNPNGKHDINAVDKFENLLSDVAEEKSVKEQPLAERKALVSYVKAHPQIKGYFHGDTNYSEFYNLKDDEGNAVLPVFRVDSTMKGEISSKDETKLSFMFICIDTDKMQLTAREYLWNDAGKHWGDSKTVSIQTK